MKYLEFGRENSDLMVILHGGGVRAIAAILPAARFFRR